MKPHSSLLDIANYPFRIAVTARFADIDVQRHLNNARIAEFYQEGRVAFHRSLHEEFGWERPKGLRTLVAHQSTDFLDEASYPGTVDIGVGVARIGNTSYTLALSLHQAGKCVGASTVVLVHATADGPTPLASFFREILGKKLLPEAARG